MAKPSDVARAVRSLPLGALLRSTARSPLEIQAARMLKALPRTELVDLTGPMTFEATVGESAHRHSWSLGAAEQMILQAIVRSRGVERAFEIGTFNGGTTRLLAETLPAQGSVVTMDLPPRRFDATQRPEGFTGDEVGAVVLTSPASRKVTQLLCDSLTFDPAPYAGKFDLVLVDGGHEFEHGVADTRTALTLVAPGGVVLWDDFQPYWHGLVRGICQEMSGRGLATLAGSAFGVYVNAP